MNHEQLREVFSKLIEHVENGISINYDQHGEQQSYSSEWDHRTASLCSDAREALAALDREGAGVVLPEYAEPTKCPEHYNADGVLGWVGGWDACRAEVRRLNATPPAVPGWQPIETAPKDGTLIDAWTRSGRIADVFWSRDFSGDVPGFCVRHFDKRYGWVNRMIEKPTHWMPLPARPDAPAGEKGT